MANKKVTAKQVGDHFVKTWREKYDIVVQVWLNKTSPDGEPDGDWSMPKIIGEDAAVAQAVLQTQ